MSEDIVSRLREGHAVPGCSCWLCALLNEAADAFEAAARAERQRIVEALRQEAEPHKKAWMGGLLWDSGAFVALRLFADRLEKGE